MGFPIKGPMRRKLFYLTLLFVEMFSVCFLAVQAQNARREIAVTIDDLPLNGAQFETKRLQSMTNQLLDGISRHRIPVVGFVNESLLYIPGETDARIAVLKAW